MTTNAGQSDDDSGTLGYLKRLNRRLDELVRDGSQTNSPTVEQLQSRLDASSQATTIILLDRLSGILIESARASVVSTEENLHLQRRVWWLTVAAVAVAIVATVGTFAQVFYAERADSRAIRQEQSKSPTPPAPQPHP